jgi:hypothetical protein
MNFACSGDSKVFDCSFLKCKSSQDDAFSDSGAGIYTKAKDLFTLSRLNFSDCRSSASSWGVVLLGQDGFWTFSEGTVVGCSGSSGLRESLPTRQRVDSCNFYNNSFNDDSGLLCASDYGFDVSWCIFSGNTREFYLFSKSGSDGFSVTNCVFSGFLPDGNIYQETPDNEIFTVTASFSFTYFGTEYCPNWVPERTPAESPRETPSLTPARSADPTPTNSVAASATSHFDDSATLPETASHAPSPAPEASPQPASSEHFPATNGGSNSADFADSAPWSPTELCQPSPALKKSAQSHFSNDFAPTVPFNSSAAYPSSADVDASWVFDATALCQPSGSLVPPTTARSSVFVTPATPTGLSKGKLTLTSAQNLSILAGSVAGVSLLVAAIAVLLYKCRPSVESADSSQLELGLNPPTEDPGGDWTTHLGLETENPIASTIAPFADEPDED